MLARVRAVWSLRNAQSRYWLASRGPNDWSHNWPHTVPFTAGLVASANACESSFGLRSPALPKTRAASGLPLLASMHTNQLRVRNAMLRIGLVKIQIRQFRKTLGLGDEDFALGVEYFTNGRRQALGQTTALVAALHCLDFQDKEIGRILGISRDAVRQGLQRARTRLEARGKGAVVRALQSRPPRCASSYRRPTPQERPFARPSSRSRIDE